MAEIEFFAVDKEIVAVVSWLLAERCVMVPDMHYDSPAVIRLANLPEIRRLAASTPHFFIIREDLLESPQHVREVEIADKRFFYVDPRMGGPSLQFFWGRRTENAERNQLSASWLSYYNWYEDSVTGERKKVSRELIQVYSGCAKEIRAHYRRIKPSKRDFLISTSVAQLVRSGTNLIGLEGMSPDQVLGARNPDLMSSASGASTEN